MEPMVNINVRVPPELVERIEKATAIGKSDKADIIRLALECGLDEMSRVGFDVKQVYKDAIAASKALALPAQTGLQSLEAPKSSNSTPATGAMGAARKNSG